MAIAGLAIKFASVPLSSVVITADDTVLRVALTQEVWLLVEAGRVTSCWKQWGSSRATKYAWGSSDDVTCGQGVNQAPPIIKVGFGSWGAHFVYEVAVHNSYVK